MLSTFTIIKNQLRRAAILSMAYTHTIKSVGLRIFVYSFKLKTLMCLHEHF